jgi:hypothetical protein
VNQTRELIVAAQGYETRREIFEGREHIVVPVVALVEGVVYAMNAHSPELVTAEEFSRAPDGWNGRPLYHGHPLRRGRPVSGNSPEVLSERIGIVFNAGVKKNKLTMEAWIDVERCAQIAPELLKRVEAEEKIEISVGAFVDTDDSKGTYKGKKYFGAWHEIVPDHLALLPEGDTGACSVEMGCGVRAAKGAAAMDMNMYAEWLEPGKETTEMLKFLRDIPVEERNKIPMEDFAGPNRSFPIVLPEDVSAAAHSLGRAKGDRAAIKRKIISIAYRKGESFVAQLPEDWKRKSEQKDAKRSLFNRVMSFFRGSQTPDEMSDSDLRSKLYQAIREVEPECMNIDAVFPVSDPTHVVYTVYRPNVVIGPEDYMGGVFEQYERSFELSEAGTVTISTSKVEVQPVLKYEPVEGAEPIAAKRNAVAGAPCSCKKEAPTVPAAPASEEKIMSDKVKAVLDGKNAEQIAALESFIDNGFKAAAAEPQVVEKEVKVEMTREEAIERFGLGDAVQMLAEKRTSTIRALKATGRCTISDEDLASKSQAELDQLLALAGSKPAVDFGGQGAPRAAEQNDENVAPAAPNLTDRIRAARSAKK